MSYPHYPGECREHHDLVRDFGGERPRIVTLCGSTRFHEEFRKANLRLTLAGEIVLSIGCDTKSDGDLAAAGELGADMEQVKARLDDLHKRKIDLCDYVLVLNPGGYVGESTRSEIAYAHKAGKMVSFLEPLPLADVRAELPAGEAAGDIPESVTELDLGLPPAQPRKPVRTAEVAREVLLSAARRYESSAAWAERHPDDPHSGDGVDYAEEMLALTARDLAEATDREEPKPVGWHDGREDQVTVSRSDLRAILMAVASELAGRSAEYRRLAEAAGVTEP